MRISAAEMIKIIFCRYPQSAKKYFVQVNANSDDVRIQVYKLKRC